MNEPTLKGHCHCQSTTWELDGDPGSITACNCSVCHRYGTLWAYDYWNERIRLGGDISSYVRQDLDKPGLEFLFCSKCACVLAWRSLLNDETGRRRTAVNIRLARFEAVAHLPIDHFEGRDTFSDLPSDGRTVRDMWF